MAAQDPTLPSSGSGNASAASAVPAPAALAAAPVQATPAAPPVAPAVAAPSAVIAPAAAPVQASSSPAAAGSPAPAAPADPTASTSSAAAAVLPMFNSERKVGMDAPIYSTDIRELQRIFKLTRCAEDRYNEPYDALCVTLPYNQWETNPAKTITDPLTLALYHQAQNSNDKAEYIALLFDANDLPMNPLRMVDRDRNLKWLDMWLAIATRIQYIDYNSNPLHPKGVNCLSFEHDAAERAMQLINVAKTKSCIREVDFSDFWRESRRFNDSGKNLSNELKSWLIWAQFGYSSGDVKFNIPAKPKFETEYEQKNSLENVTAFIRFINTSFQGCLSIQYGDSNTITSITFKADNPRKLTLSQFIDVYRRFVNNHFLRLTPRAEPQGAPSRP